MFLGNLRAHFTLATESPWPVHFKRSHWWKRRSRSKFATYTTLEGPTQCVNDARWIWSLHGFLHDIEWIVFHGHWDYFFKKPPCGGRFKLTQNWDIMAFWCSQPLIYSIFSFVRTCTNRNLFGIAFGWGPSHKWLCTTLEGSVTTLHGFGGILKRPLHTLYGALTISWSRLLAHM